MRVRRSLLPAAVAVLLTTACAPDVPLEAGLKGYPTDIVHGAPDDDAPPPARLEPAANPSPAFPGFVVPPPPPPTRRTDRTEVVAPPTTTPPPCPINPFAVPPLPAGFRIAAPPATGTYTFRQTGNFTIGTASRGVLPSEGTRLVDNVVKGGGANFRFDQSIAQFGATTTTTYQVRDIGDPLVDGLYIVRVVTKYADGSVDEFAPADAGLRIFAVPADVGVNWRSIATDPLRSTSMIVEGLISGKRRVDGCNEAFDGWVTRVKGQIIGRGLGVQKDLDFDATLVVAPQHGGLIVDDAVSISGNERGRAVTQKTRATLNSIRPKPL